MSIKKRQAILKCFIDLKYIVLFTVGSEDETMFCDTKKILAFSFSKLNDRQSYILRKFHKLKKSS